jgi:peptidyl-prolyl cis-trans isomerase C
MKQSLRPVTGSLQRVSSSFASPPSFAWTQRRVVLAVGSFLGAAALSLVLLSARQAAAEDNAVVARVGPLTITQAELHARLSKLPRIQLALLGKDDAEIKRTFLEKVLIPELLLSEGAKRRGLTDQPDLHARIRDAYRSALLATLRDEATASVTDDDVKAFFEANRARFEAKERIQIWRILTASKEDAQKIIAEAKQTTPEKWMTLAREKSLDKATNQRGGNLGFLDETGGSSEVAVRADPLLFAAAKKVKDGELVTEPVPEGEKWAVVWRRGSTPAVARSLSSEAQSIRQLLIRQRTEAAAKAIVDEGRKHLVKEVEPTLTAIVVVGKTGEVATRQKSGVTPKAPGKPRPSAVPGQGLRLRRLPRSSLTILVRARPCPSMLVWPRLCSPAWKRPSAIPSTPTRRPIGPRSSSAATTTPAFSPRRWGSATRSSRWKKSPTAFGAAKCASSRKPICPAS